LSHKKTGNRIGSGLVKFSLVAFMLLLLVSCDILRFSTFEVTAWTPGQGYHSDPAAITVSLQFSREPDRSSVECHFSLEGNSERVTGNFRWERNTVFFIPHTPLRENCDYVIAVSAEAHDHGGINLDEAVEKRFTTRPDNARPVLLSWSPSENDVITDPRCKVRLEFSAPVTITSLHNNVSFTPSMNGSWKQEGLCSAVFTPVEPWNLNKRYEMRISSSLAGTNGMTMGRDFLSVFTVGADTEKPTLAQAMRINNTGGATALVPTEAGFIATENTGWEKDDRLKLIFSEPVDGLTVRNCLSVEDGPVFILETTPGFNTEFIVRFSGVPVYDSRFTIKIKTGIRDYEGNESKNEYVFKIRANGVNSKPPELIGIRLPMAPDSEADKEPVMFHVDSVFDYLPISDENYPSTVGVLTWIEFYFDTAPGAAIDPLSLMELFRIDTSNNVLTFSPRIVKTGGFSFYDAAAGWERYQRLEIAGVLTNSVNFGIVSFLIPSGLRDNYGNTNNKSFNISVIK
jgi:hypothetical protein